MSRGKLELALQRKKGNRTYLNGKSEDIHETNLNYRKEVEAMYLQFAEKYRHWVKIDCVENNQLLSPQAIHNKILEVLKQKKDHQVISKFKS